jgi:glucose/arabinose dehydrogenase
MNNITNTFFAKRKIFLCLYLIFSTFLTFSQLPSGFTDSKSQSGYTAPMGVAFSKNGQKMFIWEKSGKVWLSKWNGSSYVKQSSPMLDISDEVGDWRDLGLHSLALDPNFDSNGLIYLYYQVDRHHLLNFGTPQYSKTTNEYFAASISRVTRYQVANDVANAGSRKILLGSSKSTGIPLLFESHVGGQIVFGADGTLLVTTGDNANFTGVDVGNSEGTYFQQALDDGILRPAENVGALRAQMVNSFCGKLLRIDPNTGDGIPSNPYYDPADSRSAKSRTWALGLRNPYRISFKTGTGSSAPGAGNPGTIFIADVQNGDWEELHILEKGGLNCGWPIFEGITNGGGYFTASATVKNTEESGSPSFQSLCVQPTSLSISSNVSNRRFTHFPPAVDWGHKAVNARYPDFRSGKLVATTIGSSGAEVAGTPFMGNTGTAGTFYTGTAFPSAFRNTYFFADYGTNWIKAAVVRDGGAPQISEIKSFAPDGYGKGIVDIEYCPLDGSIFYVNINTGDIQKISFGGNSNRPPVAVISSDKTTGSSPLTIQFKGDASSDPDGDALSYSWDFDNGTSSTSANPSSRTFTSSGTKAFTVTLTVKDNQGLTDSKSTTISTNNSAPSVKITNPTNTTKYTLSGPTTYALAATVTDNDPSGMQYAWQVTLRHTNHEHREPVSTQQNPSVQISPVGCDGEEYYYLIELKVTDNGGSTARDSVKIFPDCTSKSLNITGLLATAQANAVALKWANPTVAFDEIMVVAKEGSGFTSNPSGTSYTANSNFTGNGSAFEGGKVVYKGTGSSTTVTSLNSGKKYYFRVYARKGSSWTGGVEASATPTGTISTPTPTPTPTQQLGCLKGSYFNNKTLSGTPIVVRAESLINYNWGTSAPASGVNADNFSVRWEGTVIPTVTGTYTFSAIADDGVRVWVNNQLIIDKWFYQGLVTNNATVKLTQGQSAAIKFEFYDGILGAVAKLFWTVPNQASKAVAFNACSVNNPTTTQPPVSSFDPSKCYRFLSALSGKAFDVAGRSTISGAKIIQNTWTGDKSQIWRIRAIDGSYQRITSWISGKVLDVKAESTDDGKFLQQFDYNGGSNQLFKFDKTGNNYFISARHSGKFIDIENQVTSSGATLIQMPKRSSNSNSQQWQVLETTCPTGTNLVAAQIYIAEGYREGKNGILTWVSNAADADYFMVEKQDKNGDFETIDLVNAKPLNLDYEKNYYTFTDNQTLEGENTYRITLISDNTPPQYSKTITLNFREAVDFTLFPNPTSDFIDVDLSSYEDRPVKLTVVSMQGRELLSSKIEKASKTHRMVLDNLMNGQYIILIQTKGKRDVTRMFNITK